MNVFELNSIINAARAEGDVSIGGRLFPVHISEVTADTDSRDNTTTIKLECEVLSDLDPLMKIRDYTMYAARGGVSFRNAGGMTPIRKMCFLPEIKDVIFNDPATIVFWTDGSKTVVKVQNGEPFDPEKGLAMAVVKKAFGNEGSYFNRIKKWTDKYEEQKAAENDITNAFEQFKQNLLNAFNKGSEV